MHAHQILGIGAINLPYNFCCQVCQHLLPRAVLDLGQAPQEVCQVAGCEVGPLLSCTQQPLPLRANSQCAGYISYCAP